MNYAFHPEAVIEFEQAIEYYEDCQKALGYAFASDIHDTIEHIVNFPSTWPEVQSGIHRCLTRHFPYGVLYSTDADSVLILAVMRLHRSPNYWKHRTP